MTKQLTELQEKTAEELKTFVLREAKTVFESDETLTSFGWSQFTSLGDSFTKKHAVYNTRQTPDINGNSAGGQYHSGVTEFLQQFRMEMLLMAFGNDCSVTVYNDLTCEVHDY